jgi:hypothetical protein
MAIEADVVQVVVGSRLALLLPSEARIQELASQATPMKERSSILLSLVEP